MNVVFLSIFSRRASEVVSPSDLPDSPGETRPSSPRAPLKFTAKIQINDSVKPSAMQAPSEPKNKSPPKTKSSVFEDVPHLFAEEGTPLQFSQATSLSSLPLCFEASDDNEGSTKKDNADLGSCGSQEDKQSSPDSPDSAEFQVL